MCVCVCAWPTKHSVLVAGVQYGIYCARHIFRFTPSIDKVPKNSSSFHKMRAGKLMPIGLHFYSQSHSAPHIQVDLKST